MLAELLNSPQGQGLLAAAFGAAASARRGAPLNTLGAGGLAGLSAFGNAQDRITQQKQDTLRQDYLTMQLGQMKRSQARDEKLRALPEQFMRSPTQTVLANGQGPTLANAAALETAQPSFDMPGWLNARMAIDPEGTLDLKSKQAKETPFGKINPADYTPESVQRFAQTGNYGALAPVRKRDIHNGQVVDLYSAHPGQRIDDINPNQPFHMVNGQVVSNNPFQQYSLDKARAGSSSTNVSYGAPVPALDAQGRPVFFQPGKDGGPPKIVPGVQPPKIGDEMRAADEMRAKDLQTVDASLSVLDKALTHPGRATATGMSGTIDPRNVIPGTDARDYRALADQIQGKAFLQAFETLKGGGQITEVEGKKATDAIARLDRAQSDAEYETALRELRGVMGAARRRISAGARRSGGASGSYQEDEALAQPSSLQDAARAELERRRKSMGR